MTIRPTDFAARARRVARVPVLLRAGRNPDRNR
jgi:hypothetical protein